MSGAAVVAAFSQHLGVGDPRRRRFLMTPLAGCPPRMLTTPGYEGLVRAHWAPLEEHWGGGTASWGLSRFCWGPLGAFTITITY